MPTAVARPITAQSNLLDVRIPGSPLLGGATLPHVRESSRPKGDGGGTDLGGSRVGYGCFTRRTNPAKEIT
jgi:hypothetical protein